MDLMPWETLDVTICEQLQGGDCVLHLRIPIVCAGPGP